MRLSALTVGISAALATIALGLALGATSLACSPSHQTPIADGGDADAADAAPAAVEWTPVLEHLDGALLAIWGTSEKDIWTVGGPLGSAGFESLVMRYDGNVWHRSKTGGAETYWWVHGTGPNDVWLVGEKGRITHWDGTKFEERASGTTATLFGVWAAAPNDAWAVGGVPDQPDQPNDVVLHWDGTSWKPETLPEQKKVALFKVWGSSAGDVYIVGEAGLVWHRNSGAWKREADGIGKGRLTTVTGCSPTEIFAVGGRDLLTSNGTQWKRSDAVLVNDVNGVACAPAGAPAREWGRAVIVGGGSLKLRLVGDRWESDFGSKPFSDLHGSWVDPTGAFWGAGGSFNATPRPGVAREGVVARYGAGTVSSIIAP
jgi:hypothetical protein